LNNTFTFKEGMGGMQQGEVLRQTDGLVFRSKNGRVVELSPGIFRCGIKVSDTGRAITIRGGDAIDRAKKLARKLTSITRRTEP
jgi:hypothetical protein